MACAPLASGFVFSYYEIVILVAALMGFYTGIKYAAGKFFTNTDWAVSAWVDLSEIWKSLIAMFLAVGFFEFSRSLSCAWAGDDPINVAIQFLQKIMLRGVVEAINDVFTIQIFYSTYNTFAFRPHEAVWTWTYKIAPGADSIVNITNVIGYGLAAIMGSLSAQVAILTLISATMYTLFLPAGLLLRFFPPTRDAGVFLITMSIGFQVVFPMTYVFNKMALDEIWVYTRGTLYTPYIGSSAMGVWKYIFLGSAFPVTGVGSVATNTANAIKGLLGISSPFLTTGINVISASFMEITAYNITFGLFRPILEALAELSLVSLFLPTLSTMLTFAFINALTKFIQTKVS